MLGWVFYGEDDGKIMIMSIVLIFIQIFTLYFLEYKSKGEKVNWVMEIIKEEFGEPNGSGVEEGTVG